MASSIFKGLAGIMQGKISKELVKKFKVYPSAYANMYASAVCSGKVTPGGKKRKKAMDGGMMREGYRSGGKIAKGCGRVMSNRRKKTKTY